MTAPMDCRLVGRWRIVEADLWDRDYLDLVVPRRHDHRRGRSWRDRLRGHAGQPRARIQPRSMVIFTWAGFDEMDQVSGSGSAELNDDGTIEIAFAYHLGDEALLKAETDDFFNSLLGVRGDPYAAHRAPAGAQSGEW